MLGSFKECSQKTNLETHNDLLHKKTRHSYNQFEYVATTEGNLRTHGQSVPEKVKLRILDLREKSKILKTIMFICEISYEHYNGSSTCWSNHSVRTLGQNQCV